MLTWKFASPEDYIPVCELFKSSGLSHGYNDILRRIHAPLFLKQVVTFYENSKLCGFVTFAFLNDDAENHMPITGIDIMDWRSGKNFWVIDFVAKHSGYQMLRSVTKGLGVKKARYFRHKFQNIREVRAA